MQIRLDSLAQVSYSILCTVCRQGAHLLGVYFSQICNMKIEVKTSGATFSNLAGDDVDQTGP
jgi:hypothetical protein